MIAGPWSRRWRAGSPPARGIGLALALTLREKGDTVVVGGRRTELLTYGEARGDYDQVVAALNAGDPHGG